MAATPAGRLIVVGNVIVDLVMTVDALPEPGGDVVARSSSALAGGEFNAITAAVRDGAAVVFAGQYGTGPFGSIVRRALRDADVSVVQSGIDSADSGYCVALVDASAERTFVTAAGAEGMLDRAGLDRVDARPGDLVFVSGYCLAHPIAADALPAWLPDLAGETRVMLDPGPLAGTLPADALAAVLGRTDILTLNAREARILGGRAVADGPDDTGDLDAAAVVTRLAAAIRPGGTVVVRDGARGALVAADGRDPVRIAAPDVVAVDTSGAGDTHDGVLAAALLRGVPLLDAVRRANAAAALSVTRPGPATAPEAADTDRMLARL